MLALENSTLSIFERREINLDISELLLQAQEKKRPVNSVIENNIEDFIERIKLSYGYRNGILFNILSGIQNLLFVLTIVQATIYLIRNTDPFFKTTMGLMILPYMFLLSFLLLPLLKYLISRQKIIWFVIALVGLVSLDLGSNELLRRFGSDIAWVQTYFRKRNHFYQLMVHCNYPNPCYGIKLACQMVYEAPVDKKNESSMVRVKL